MANYKDNNVRAISATGLNLGTFCSASSATGLAFDQGGNLFVASANG